VKTKTKPNKGLSQPEIARLQLHEGNVPHINAIIAETVAQQVADLVLDTVTDALSEKVGVTDANSYLLRLRFVAGGWEGTMLEVT
jgi:hypothetical protein